MNTLDDRPIQPSTLPELEHLLLRAARGRAAKRFGRRRWVLALAASSLLLAGAAAAATGVFQIAGGETSDGTFSIESRVVPPQTGGGHLGSICLRLRFNGGGPAYGCGGRPSATKPFGLVIADPLDNGGERVIYGLVSGEITRVSILGEGGSRVDAITRQKAELPGRFFSAVTPRDGRIELLGYGGDGREVARLGSLEPGSNPPLSKAEAMAQGDPAGFAPGIAAPDTYVYKGETIDPNVATRRQLVCLQTRERMRCYDTVAEVEEAVRR